MKPLFFFLPALLTFSFSRSSAQKPELGLPIGHRDEIIHLDFSRDGRYVLTAGMSSMKLWDFNTGKLLVSNDQSGATYYAKFSPDANKVYFVQGGITDDPVYSWWDIERNMIAEGVRSIIP